MFRKKYFFASLSFVFVIFFLLNHPSSFAKESQTGSDKKISDEVQKIIERFHTETESDLQELLQSYFPGVPKKVISSRHSVWKMISSAGYATGFFISPTQFVTNFHAVELLLNQVLNLDSITLTQDNNPKKLRIKSIQRLSAFYDLAILEIEGEVKNYLNLQITAGTPTVYEDLFVLGYPGREPLTILKKTGKLTYLHNIYTFYVDHYLKLNGASGSPVLNKQGGVVGVLFASGPKSTLFGYKSSHVIRINHLKDLLKEEAKTFSNSYEDVEKELEKLHRMAEEGSVEAQIRLGDIFENDNNMEQAFYWNKKAAEQEGFAKAHIKLSRMYLRGEGTPRNLKMAIYYFLQAHNQAWNLDNL